MYDTGEWLARLCTTFTVRTVKVSYTTAERHRDRRRAPHGGTLIFVPTLDNLWRPSAQTIRVPIHDDAVPEREETP